MYNGLGTSLDDLARRSSAVTRSISAENFTGEKGKAGMATEGTGASCARDLGIGWKVSPSVSIKAHSTFTLADIKAEGAIKHIWLTGGAEVWRWVILRIYWDGSDVPAVEAPVCDFFANPLPDTYSQLSSLAVCVNPRIGMNCYWTMPFKKEARVTIENMNDKDCVIYYQIDYVETKLDEEPMYFCAHWSRTNPLPYKEVYTILDGVKGSGQFVGTSMLWGVNNNGWWGEGEIKFYLDGDKEFPTICGTGTEDYFCGAYDFDYNGGYVEFTSPYSGLSKVARPNGLYQANTRFALYRWHITDPIYFKEDIKVTIQALGWRQGGRYLPLQDDISSVAYWYQDAPYADLAPLPDRDYLELN